jgi:hypothetical protein
MFVTTLIIFLVLDIAWIAYAIKTAPAVEEDDFLFDRPENEQQSVKLNETSKKAH